MQDILLTPHFKLSEFINSPTAKARGIDNTLNPSVDEHRRIIANLTRICQEILEPLRTYANSISPHKQGEPEEVPITISSGYRCPQLNAAVGGVKNSQHMTGEAVDIGSASSPTAIKELRSWMEFIINETDFDQCILEHTKSGVYWIHVSCKSNPALNRHHAISFLLKN